MKPWSNNSNFFSSHQNNEIIQHEDNFAQPKNPSGYNFQNKDFREEKKTTHRLKKGKNLNHSFYKLKDSCPIQSNSTS